MATTTTNLGLIEPAGQDRALVANINTNSEKIDAEAGKARANFALVQNGDTATQAISQGQLVNWKGVLKKATANIANGATLSSSNLTDDSIAAELASLNNKIMSYSSYNIEYDEGYSDDSGESYIRYFANGLTIYKMTIIGVNPIPSGTRIAVALNYYHGEERTHYINAIGYNGSAYNIPGMLGISSSGAITWYGGGSPIIIRANGALIR